jgi:hypothetical protein
MSYGPALMAHPAAQGLMKRLWWALPLHQKRLFEEARGSGAVKDALCAPHGGDPGAAGVVLDGPGTPQTIEKRLCVRRSPHQSLSLTQAAVPTADRMQDILTPREAWRRAERDG